MKRFQYVVLLLAIGLVTGITTAEAQVSRG